jgi:hypothetical protein
MSVKEVITDVRVDKQILWFDADAYPLQNIARTSTKKLVPNRGPAIRSYIIQAVLWLFAASVVAAAAPGTLSALVFVGVLAWLGYRLYGLIQFLNRVLYELVIETAAGSHRGLVSYDWDLVAELTVKITDAINNPQAKLHIRAKNVQVGGENYIVNGKDSVGKQVR